MPPGMGDPSSGSPRVVDRSIGAFVARVQEVRDRLDGLEKLDAKIESAQAALDQAKAERDQEGRNTKWLELHLRADYPEAAFLIGGAAHVAPVRETRKRREPTAKKEVVSGRLTVDQAEQVLAALASTFSLAEFRKMTGTLFPGTISKGGIDILGDKIASAGGKGMGTKFKKSPAS